MPCLRHLKQPLFSRSQSFSRSVSGMMREDDDDDDGGGADELPVERLAIDLDDEVEREFETFPEADEEVALRANDLSCAALLALRAAIRAHSSRASRSNSS